MQTIDDLVSEQYPSLPSAQQRSLATWLHNGWTFVDIGREKEVNVSRGEGVSLELGYIRPDGIFRPA